MSSSLRDICLVALTVFVQANEIPDVIPEPWGRIRSFLEQDTGRTDTEFTKYLKSLTTDEMLLAAKQACQEVERRADDEDELSDAPRIRER